jgi:hypothetical protein
MEFLRSKKFKKRREYNKRVTKRYVRIYSTLLHVTSMCSIFEASGFYIWHGELDFTIVANVSYTPFEIEFHYNNNNLDIDQLS